MYGNRILKNTQLFFYLFIYLFKKNVNMAAAWSVLIFCLMAATNEPLQL